MAPDQRTTTVCPNPWPLQFTDLHLNGVNINVLPCGLIGTINSALKTVSLFDAANGGW